MATLSTSAPARRKRGRPRKDGNVSMEISNTQLVYPTNQENIKRTHEMDANSRDEHVNCAVGSAVYGVIDGSFDGGYLVSLKIGNNDVPYRGLVFQPRKRVPITAANDVAPQAKMHLRHQVLVSGYGDSSHSNGFNTAQALKQPAFHTVSPSFPLPVTPYQPSNPSNLMLRSNSCSDLAQKLPALRSSSNIAGVDTQCLRMVEEDEVMQAFEVSSPLKWPNSIMPIAGDAIALQLHSATTSSADKQDISNRGAAPSLLYNSEQNDHCNSEVEIAPILLETHQEEAERSEIKAPQEVPAGDQMNSTSPFGNQEADIQNNEFLGGADTTDSLHITWNEPK